MHLTDTAVKVISVAEYSARIVRALRTVGGGVVEGEVQKPRVSPGGMLFFDLTDGTATLACKVFSGQAARLEHRPRHGDLVQVIVERPDVWSQAGKLDIIVADVRLAGEGQILQRREKLLRSLTAEGLCDPSRRRPRPRFPRAVGVIAGANSDGMRDVVAALQSRFPPVHIVTCPAVVQGVRAPLDIIDALARLEAHPQVDVIVIARGGGSVQDLVAFDDERLCRAVFACSTPVIAAIGHTDNVPVCNHVAWNSETPSRSAELAIPSARELRQGLQHADAGLAAVSARLRAATESVRQHRVEVAGAISARQSEVAGSAAELLRAQNEFLASRARVLSEAREALAGVPGRIPAVSDVRALAAGLDRHAVAFFSERADDVRSTDFSTLVAARLDERATQVRTAALEPKGIGRALDDCKATVSRVALPSRDLLRAIEARRRGARDQGERLRAGIRKELADHAYHHGRALARLSGATRDSVLRQLAARRQAVGDTSARADEGCRRQLQDARRSVQHACEVLAASDPRRRGWVLPTDSAGAVVRSVMELAIGDRLTLSFHDGIAGAVINNTPKEDK